MKSSSLPTNVFEESSDATLLAYNRIENKPKKSNRGQLPPGLKVESEEARRFWMSE